QPENIIVGNGSDELLAMAVRAFAETRNAECGARNDACTVVQYFTPSYSLYPVLAATHGANTNAVALAEDFALPSMQLLKRRDKWNFNNCIEGKAKSSA